MKVVVQVRLLPSAVQAAALLETLHACNAAADKVSKMAFERGVHSRNDLQKLVYADVRGFGLGAQAAVRTIKKVVDACASLQASIRTGNLAGPRRRKAEGKAIRFRKGAAQPFDDRMLSWRYDARTVSIWTTSGRLKGVRIVGHPAQLDSLRSHRRGETDLVRRDGKWLLIATCEVPEPEPVVPSDWIGVDRGIVNLATTSDGTNFQGLRLRRYRRWQERKRAELRVKRTKSATRRLRRRARREHRHVTNVNHVIAKKLVAVAQRTGRGIALEDLRGIRNRVQLRRDQRAIRSSWPFHQLGAFIAYKARRAGVVVITVDARFTSQMCPGCGHTARDNRRDRDRFCCRRCGFAGPADHVAGINVRNRARSAWVLVNVPEPAA
ncbi:RNA-guided endonuclease InsQ/TnpB family protein [Lentzea aerocolonigenes]|uniref:RNA-guided endonuclease InsQ/TnpB family protein n=1 Tax=Lentzea aerocolonigenes TaxID=68170 RepID=UPI000ADFD964|nr:RNA-guided endonuclease TnpB family protein [Lentzea aerocolonigenes]